jgi:hypothetical protein
LKYQPFGTGVAPLCDMTLLGEHMVNTFGKKGRPMKSLITIALLLGCMLWPATADLCDFRPEFQYALPADIMRVDFAHESWTYRLFEDGTVKKFVEKRPVPNKIFAVNDNTTGQCVPPDLVTG